MPAYVQLAQQIREAVLLGALSPGEQLPSVRDVAAASGVNHNTVGRTYRELAAQGLVESRPGAGVFVSASTAQPTPQAVRRVQAQLARLVRSAREAGLGQGDIESMLRTALAADSRGSEEIA